MTAPKVGRHSSTVALGHVIVKDSSAFSARERWSAACSSPGPSVALFSSGTSVEELLNSQGHVTVTQRLVAPSRTVGERDEANQTLVI